MQPSERKLNVGLVVTVAWSNCVWVVLIYYVLDVLAS